MQQPKDYYESERVEVISNTGDLKAIREELLDRKARFFAYTIMGIVVGTTILVSFIYMII